jgi:two-component system chemotaxis response regulator CheY
VNILLVESDPVQREFIRTCLLNRSAIWSLYIADTLAKGIELAHDVQPAIVILALALPETRGLATLKAFLDSYSQASILITTSDTNGVGRAAVDAGATDFLLKPFTGPALLERLELTVGKREASTHHREPREKIEHTLHTVDAAIRSAKDSKFGTTPVIRNGSAGPVVSLAAVSIGLMLLSAWLAGTRVIEPRETPVREAAKTQLPPPSIEQVIAGLEMKPNRGDLMHLHFKRVDETHRADVLRVLEKCAVDDDRLIVREAQTELKRWSGP